MTYQEFKAEYKRLALLVLTYEPAEESHLSDSAKQLGDIAAAYPEFDMRLDDELYALQQHGY